jgi:segregation and condensation protein B
VTDGLSIQSLVESLLFVAGEPVRVDDLARALEVPTPEVEAALTALSDDYRQRGLRLQRKDNRVQLVSAPESAGAVERFLGLQLSSKLSPAALETLAIIAYQQPVTRPQIEAIRGVNSDGVVRTLLARGLIEEVGRLEQAGRPILYGTTFAFLQQFGLSDVSELPPLNGDKVTR